MCFHSILPCSYNGEIPPLLPARPFVSVFRNADAPPAASGAQGRKSRVRCRKSYIRCKFHLHPVQEILRPVQVRPASGAGIRGPARAGGRSPRGGPPSPSTSPPPPRGPGAAAKKILFIRRANPFPGKLGAPSPCRVRERGRPAPAVRRGPRMKLMETRGLRISINQHKN